MQSKKTIVLTIIGVLVMLFLVIGATFAYFTSSEVSDGKTSVITGQAGEVGSVALTNPTKNLHITLSALDMAQNNLGAYYATDDSTLNYDEEETQREIAVATLSGGSSSTYYECSATVNVEVTGSMASNLSEGDAYIQFGGLLTDKVDLTNVSSTGYPVAFTLNGTDTLSESVSAAIAIENRNVNQNAIAGQELSVKFTNTDFSCKILPSTNSSVINSSTIALNNSAEGNLVGYKIYGNSIQDGTPSPDTPVEIQSVGDYDESTGKYVIPISIKKKNLFDASLLMDDYTILGVTVTNNGDGTLTLDGTTTQAVDISIFNNLQIALPRGNKIKVMMEVLSGNVSSTLHVNVSLISGDSTITNGITLNEDDYGYSAIYNVTSDVKMSRVRATAAQGITFDKCTIRFWYMIDNDDRTYEPYVEPITTNIYLDEPLRKIGDARDYIDFENKKIVRNITTLKLVGTENWIDGAFAASGFIYISVATKKIGDTNLISNYFPTVSYAAADSNQLSGRNNNTAITFSPSDSVATTEAEWISWLETKNNSGNPLIVHYELETAVEESVSLPDISTFDGTTTIEIGTTVIPSNFEVTYTTR